MLRPLALALLAAAAPAAQVRQSQTISATAGGFVGPLADFDHFGVSAAAVGDLDGDGTPDLVVGASRDRQNRGAVWVLFLRRDGTVRADRAVRLAGVTDQDLFGTSVTALGDLDGDGRPEIAVGADHTDDGGPDRGAVWIVSLNPDGSVHRAHAISATRGGLADAPADGDLFGHSVAGIGDLDGDGTPDLAVGGDDADDGGPERGAVWILFLRPDGTVRQSQRVSDTAGGFAGTLRDGDLFGQAVAALGDLDGDGIPDLAVSATRADGVGAVWVLLLNRDGTVRADHKIGLAQGGFAGALNPGDVFGSSLVGPGDLDGDGVPDLIVGANGDGDGGPRRGAGWVLFLGRAGAVRSHQKISATEGGAIGPFADGDEWNPTASLGDLDGDGAADLVWGSRLADDGGPELGAARVAFTGYAVSQEEAPARLRLQIGRPVPNPARVRVRLDIGAPDDATGEVVDVLGRRVANLGALGRRRIEIDVSGWAAGVYVVRLQAGGRVVSRTLSVVR